MNHLPPVAIGATDADDARTVELLHYMSKAAARANEDFVATVLRDAATALDEYRAGLRLAMPHGSTGYQLLPFPQLAEAA